MVSVVGDPEITAMVRHHHERIDGEGYPDELSGAAIPLGARIIAVADNLRRDSPPTAPYRAAGSQKHALKVLSVEAGAQLDADAVAAFEHDLLRAPLCRLVLPWARSPCSARAAAISSLSGRRRIGPPRWRRRFGRRPGCSAVSPRPVSRIARPPQPANGSSALAAARCWPPAKRRQAKAGRTAAGRTPGHARAGAPERHRRPRPHGRAPSLACRRAAHRAQARL